MRGNPRIAATRVWALGSGFALALFFVLGAFVFTGAPSGTSRGESAIETNSQESTVAHGVRTQGKRRAHFDENGPPVRWLEVERAPRSIAAPHGLAAWRRPCQAPRRVVSAADDDEERAV